MSKTVQSVKNSLKFKAQVKSGLLSVRVGVKKYVLPVGVRMIANGDYMFLSFPANSELYKIENKKNLIAMDPKADATAAHTALNVAKRRGRRKSGTVELPSSVKEALKAIPAGYKLVFDAAGSPRLAKTRKRRAKSAK